MNEAETRAEHIDPALAAAGWGAVGGSRSRPSRCPTECLHCLLILVRVIGIRRSVSVRVAWIQQSIII